MTWRMASIAASRCCGDWRHHERRSSGSSSSEPKVTTVRSTLKSTPGSYRSAPITSCAPTRAKSARMATSKALVTNELCGTGSVHFTLLFK